jgi:long-chain acyl-CoA synthetase
MVNIAELVWAHAKEAPERIALRSPRAVTYAQLRLANQLVAGAARTFGVQPLDRVLLIAPSVPEFVEIHLGLQAAGATVITMNVMSTTTEIDYVLADSAASLVIAWHESSAAARRSAEDRGVDLWVIAPKHDFGSQPIDEPFAYAPNDTAVILYSSGTTGPPKGAELTAANVVDTALAFVPVLCLDGDDRFGTALPLFHVYGQVVCQNTVLARGASLSLLPKFDPLAMLEMMRRDKLTAIAGVPTMWNAMLNVGADASEADFRHLRLATSGGASLPVEVIRAFKQRFGCDLLEGYGLTESTGAATFNDITRVRKAGTVGRPLPGMNVQIRDQAGSALAADEVGEIYLKGISVMKGYWNRTEATATDLRDGWLRTGDIGSLDGDGYLTIKDRAKELIIRGGYNVYPREVEEVLYRHPDIVEAAVIGIPDQYYGEEIAAVVVLTAGSTLDAELLRRWVKDYLSAYKVPRLIAFVDTLPKGPTGKILKRAINRDDLRTIPAERSR